MDKKKYIEYLLRNCYRLKEEFSKDEQDRGICLVNFLDKDEERDLIKDITIAINFYESLDIIKREIMILRFLKSKLIKEVAEITNYSESNIKLVLTDCKNKFLEMLE
ncbi:hypothetical protein [Gemelliphila palaticanis]|uniref:Uncharacterized protein n=1 Tax=Gemelliphila palaticanis TaxID=81950 RepID=A0ABX2T0S2_9BACL|nr:hypothetical protein [Gemella palaticanis]MBF0716062.1 hypothetical protein [Gemella palaticanis]NYS47992.1 hypothetical protein [Gemella palaticanis]